MVRSSQHTIYRMELSGEEIKHDRYENSGSVLTVPPLSLQRCRSYAGGQCSSMPYTRCHRDRSPFSHLIRHAWETVGSFNSLPMWGNVLLYYWFKKIIFYHFLIDLTPKGILSSKH